MALEYAPMWYEGLWDVLLRRRTRRGSQFMPKFALVNSLFCSDVGF